VTNKVFPVPECFLALVDVALEWRVVFLAVLVEFMGLSKCQPAFIFIASQGIFDIVFARLHSGRLCNCSQIELLRNTIAVFGMR